LKHSDSAVQYAAGLKLAQTGDASITTALLALFVRTRSYFALRLLVDIKDLGALDTLIEVFKTEPWSDRRGWDTRFRCSLRAAIGRFGAQAVSKVTPLLRSELIEMQIAVLRTLGETESTEAGTLILEWPHTLQELCSRAHSMWAREALQSLARLKDLRALPFFAELIHEEPGWAIETLASYDHPEASKPLVEFSESKISSPFLRIPLPSLRQV
jgi:hypothetical protein